MKKDFQHVLITHFNLPLFGSLKGLEEKWLKDRFNLFDKYCFPSVFNQTNKDFIWFVYFNDKTPKKYMKKIQKYQEEFENFTPVFCSTKEQYDIKEKKLAQSFKKDSDWVLTTMLDNDDMLNKNYINEIQNSFYKKHFSFLDFIHGYNYDVNNCHLKKRIYEHNPFSSCIKKADKIDKLSFGDHPGIYKLGCVKSIRTKPMWCAITHGDNVSNHMKGINASDSSYFQENFNKDCKIDHDYSLIGIVNSIKYSIKYLACSILYIKISKRKLFIRTFNKNIIKK